MAFNTGAALLDALVLSTAAREPTYGYRITQDVRQIMVVSESTLYPVLRRLQKEGYLETYDQEFAGRNRRYYRLTEPGGEAPTDPEPTEPGTPPEAAKVLLEQAQNAFVAADTALRDGDLAEYQRQIAVAQKAMDDALAQLNR